MNCTKCNAPIPEGSKFCTVCGQKVEIPAAPAAPAAKFCPNCGKQLAEGARFCASCGAATEAPAAPVAAPAPVAEPAPAPQPAPVAEPVPAPQPAPQPVYQPAPQPVYQPVYQAPVATAAPKKKSKVGLIIAVVVIALALVGGVVAGFATDWFGLAASSYVDEDDDDGKGNGKVDLDGDEDEDPNENDDQPGGNAVSGSGAFADVAQSLVETVEEGNFTMYLNISDGYDTYYVDLYTDSNFRSQDFLLDAKVYSNDMEMELAYYDGYLIASMDGEIHALKATPEQLMQYAQESVPAAGTGMNAAATIHSFEDILDLLRQNMDAETLEQIEEVIDLDVLLDCLDTLGRSLQDNSWLEDNLALETTRDGATVTYTFDSPNFANLADTLVEMFTPAIKDADMVASLKESLDSVKSQLRSIGLYMSFNISNGMLTEGTFNLSAGGEEIAFNLTMADVNNTEVDADRLQDLLDDAEIEYFEDLFQEQGDIAYEESFDDSDIAVEIA